MIFDGSRIKLPKSNPLSLLLPLSSCRSFITGLSLEATEI